MKKTYVKPLQAIAFIDASQLICESNFMLGYSDSEFAQHGYNPEEDEILVKRNSIWDDAW